MFKITIKIVVYQQSNSKVNDILDHIVVLFVTNRINYIIVKPKTFKEQKLH